MKRYVKEHRVRGVRLVHDRIEVRAEQRKILMVISDNVSADNSTLLQNR